MNPTPHRTRNRLIIAAILVLVCIGIIVLSISHKKPTPVTQSKNTETSHYDANSHQTVSTIPGENNTSGTIGNAPYYLGVNTLINHGVASDQITNMETAFYQYSQVNNLNIKQVSISVDTVATGFLHQGTDDQISTATFNVVFDSKTTVKAQLQYSGLSSMELFLYDTNGAQLYDSGIIDTSS